MITLTNFAARWKKEYNKDPSKFPRLQRRLDIYKSLIDTAPNAIEKGKERSYLLNLGLKDISDKRPTTRFNKNQQININRINRINELRNNIDKKVTTHKPKLNNKVKLGIAVLATGAGIAAIRKARSDKGIKRGNYKK